MDAILEPLVASPDLPRHLETLERFLVDERARRKQFYEEMTEEQKIEFINGEVVMHSPVKIRHTDTVINLLVLIRIYVSRHDLGWVGSEKNLICLTRNDYEPDVVFYGREKAALLQPDQMKLPAPDFVAEVLSPSTENTDRGIKHADYAAHGVREYWIIDPVAESVEQYVRVEPYRPDTPGTFRLLGTKSGDEEMTSAVVAGFRLPAKALFERQANLDALAMLAAG